MRPLIVVAMLSSLPASLVAQQKILPAAQQITLAVLPMPMSFRADATVLGYDARGKMVTLRAGKGTMTCLAPDPKNEQFHVACYANSMEPFMARGRALRASGVKDPKVDSVRYAEAKSGKIPMPKTGAALWTLTGPWTAVNPTAGTVTAAVNPLYEVYLPYATAATTGLPETPMMKGPWLMDPGTPKAHIMFAPSMEH